MNFSEHIKELATLITRVKSLNEMELNDELVAELFQTEALIEKRIQIITDDFIPAATAEEQQLFEILKLQFLDLADFKG